MRNRYKLYEVEHMKGMMMFKFITDHICNNIIEAEDYFDGRINSGAEYIITIERI